MKRLIYTLLAAITLTGCRINDGYTYEPTRTGKQLFDITRETIIKDSETLVVLLHFNEYLSATDESAREEIHNRYFYTSRIFESDGTWHIIDSEREIFITTGGKLLSESDCEWRIGFKGYSAEQQFFSLSPWGDDDGKNGDVFRYATLDYEYTVEVAKHATSFDGKEAIEYGFSYSGTGVISRYRATTYFDITEPTMWRSTDTGRLYGGWMKLWCFDDDLRYEVSAQPSDSYSQFKSVRIFYEKFIKTYYY